MLMSVLFAIFLSFNVAFAADNNDKSEVATTEKAATEVVVETVEAETKESMNPAGIHCSASNGEMEVSCWFCNCAALADSIK
jgi:hypothetical protein